MPKKATPVEKAPSAERQRSIAGLDVAALFHLLEHDNASTDSPYRRLYAETREDFLQSEDAVEFAALLASVDEACGVETATRAAGFVLGFTVCRQLLLGELDLAAVKAGGE